MHLFTTVATQRSAQREFLFGVHGVEDQMRFNFKSCSWKYMVFVWDILSAIYAIVLVSNRLSSVPSRDATSRSDGCILLLRSRSSQSDGENPFIASYFVNIDSALR